MGILSVYWAPGHQRQADIDYMQQLQPPATRVLDPDPNQLTIAFKAASRALSLPRDWALSEQHDDVRNNPVATGKRHAQDWRGKIDRWRAGGHMLPHDEQIIVVGINEPRVWDMLPQVVEYNVAMLDECTDLGLRACALNLSVGWPANTGAGTPPDWTPYAPIEAAIKRGNHILVLHEYWYRTGPQDNWGWWAGRLQHCPWDVPIIIGECGIDMYVDMKRWENDGKPNRGWRGNVSADQYAAQMERYARDVDTRVIAILPFLTDYRSNNWESFDTLEAHPHLLARKDRMLPQVEFSGHPTPTPDSPVAIVITTVGANIRSGPGRNYKTLGAVPHGTHLPVIGRNADTENPWWQVQSQWGNGWVAGIVVQTHNVDDVPVVIVPAPDEGDHTIHIPGVGTGTPSAPAPTSIIDPRVAQAILAIESGGRTHGENGKPLIRFEAHIFEGRAGDTAHFRYNQQKPWADQEWRRSEGDAWRPIHTGKQADEYAAFEFARSLNAQAAHESISMGAGQIMGFNHARVGFPSAEAMLHAFDSAPVQTIAFINYFLSDPALVQAMQRKDWREIAKRYNGAGAVDTYAPLLEKAYKELGS